MRASVVVWVLLVGCGPAHETLADEGANLATDPTIAQSRYNAFACTTCHAVHATDVGTRILPGAVLEGATERPSWWGGNVLDLYGAVDDCYMHFMQGPMLSPTGSTAQALDAYLTQLDTTAPAATRAVVPFTVPPTVMDLAPGDTTSGQMLYERACVTCHGSLHNGNGRLGTASILPEDTLTVHGSWGPACVRDIFIEKIRHGSFLGYAGSMPPFSMEVLSDAQVQDIIAYLGAQAGGTCVPP